MSELSLTVRKTIQAPARRLFEAWLDPTMLATFMTPSGGMTVPKVETDPRVGGGFTIIMAAGERQIPHHGIYKEISPHTRLVFTWESPFTEPGSTVTLTFTPAGDGMTDVELTHVRFPSAESRANHESGWQSFLNALAEMVAA